MRTSEDLIGCIAVSTAGRDCDRTLVIIGICDDDSVFVSDGRLRKVATPKKKENAASESGFQNGCGKQREDSGRARY